MQIIQNIHCRILYAFKGKDVMRKDEHGHAGCCSAHKISVKSDNQWKLYIQCILAYLWAWMNWDANEAGPGLPDPW